MSITYTAQQIIQEAQELEPADAIRYMQWMNEAHLYITTQRHLVPDVTSLMTMVANQQEYPLPDSVATIWDAQYWPGGFVSGAQNYFPLKATNVDTLFEDRGPGWQLQPSAQPWGYYERGGNIGFVPAPLTAGDQVQLFYTPATVLTLQSTLPTNINSGKAWMYHMLRQACVIAHPEKLDFYEKAFQREMHYLKEYTDGRTGRDRARVSYRVGRIRRA